MNLRFKILFLIIFLLPYQAHADLRNGLVGWWKFDEASGNAIDSSSQGNTGTVTGTTVVLNCKRGRCRSFNGTSDHITLGTFTGLGTSNRSVSVWFSVPGGAGSRRVFTLPADQGTTDTPAIMVNANSVGASIEFGGTPWDCGVTLTLIPNAWNHVVGTIEVHDLYIPGIMIRNAVVRNSKINQ